MGWNLFLWEPHTRTFEILLVIKIRVQALEY